MCERHHRTALNPYLDVKKTQMSTLSVNGPLSRVHTMRLHGHSNIMQWTETGMGRKISKKTQTQTV